MHLSVLSEYMSGSEGRNPLMSRSERRNQGRDTVSVKEKEDRERAQFCARIDECLMGERVCDINRNNRPRK